MVTNSENKSKVSEDNDYLKRDDIEDNNPEKGTDASDSPETASIAGKQEEPATEKESTETASEAGDAKDIAEEETEKKAKAVAGTAIDENIKEKLAAEHEAERKEMAENAGTVSREISTVEELNDIGQSEEEFAREETLNEEKHRQEREKEHDEEEDERETEREDYSAYSKSDLVKASEALVKEENIRQAENKYREVKRYYDGIRAQEMQEALEKFKADGGEEDDFEYKGDELDSRFETAARAFKEKKDRFYAEVEKNREQNLAAKNEVLEKLRKLVDSEETTTSISALKEIQNEWRKIGPVPSQYVRSLWANYSALIDRFYDKRSIYFELKELDRKKNLEAKLELCEKAERLERVENLKDAIKELNDLHEEFKHIGPAPKEDQEEVWKRFKAASDKIYARRKEYIENLKSNLKENLQEKTRLSEAVQEFAAFDSERISDWNAKTREILDLQKKWETIGSLPREHAKEVNKQFWSAFKKFFNNKSVFFKKLEGQREDNLKLKEELIARAEQLKDSDEWERTANELKELQREWKNIGPVPEKARNDVYNRFKKACDEFFERKRVSERDVEKDFEENLKRKEQICEAIEKMAEENSSDIEKVEELMDEYNEIGFVPRNAIKTIQKRFIKAVETFANNAPDLSPEDKKDMTIAAQYQKLRSSPNANRKLQRKENSIRRQISELENDIALWKNNVEFFANTDRAEKLKAEFNEKITKARKELKDLKQQLKVIRTI